MINCVFHLKFMVPVFKLTTMGWSRCWRKSLLHAYKATTDRFECPRSKAHWAVEAIGRSSHVEKKPVKIVMAIWPFLRQLQSVYFHSCQQPLAPSKRESSKTNWRWHWCSSSTEAAAGLHSREVTKFSCDSVLQRINWIQEPRHSAACLLLQIVVEICQWQVWNHISTTTICNKQANYSNIENDLKCNTSYTFSQNDKRSVEKLHPMHTQYSAFGSSFFVLSQLSYHTSSTYTWTSKWH